MKHKNKSKNVVEDSKNDIVPTEENKLVEKHSCSPGSSENIKLNETSPISESTNPFKEVISENNIQNEV